MSSLAWCHLRRVCRTTLGVAALDCCFAALDRSASASWGRRFEPHKQKTAVFCSVAHLSPQLRGKCLTSGRRPASKGAEARGEDGRATIVRTHV